MYENSSSPSYFYFYAMPCTYKKVKNVHTEDSWTCIVLMYGSTKQREWTFISDKGKKYCKPHPINLFAKFCNAQHNFIISTQHHRRNWNGWFRLRKCAKKFIIFYAKRRKKVYRIKASNCMYVCDNEKKVAAYKKIIHFAKNGLMKNCAKMWSHGYGIYENVIIKVVAIRKKMWMGNLSNFIVCLFAWLIFMSDLY